MKPIVLILWALAVSPAHSETRVATVRVQILSTMLADSEGVGEWGFAAIVEADGRRILLDTGARPETVWKNAQELKVDLSSVTDLILTHNHGDHTGGLITLRREMAKKNPKALTRAHVGSGAFWSRPNAAGREGNYLLTVKEQYEAMGGTFLEYDAPKELFPGIWLTGPVKRVHPEKNFNGRGVLVRPDGSRAEDNLPEDSSLVLNTDKGLVVVAGCGHAGIINTLEQARREIRNAPIYAAIGGWHLYDATDEHLRWTGQKLKDFGIQNFLGAHCTGIEAVYRIRQITGLSRRTCAVGAVGAGFSLKEGLQTGDIAH